MIFRHAQFDSGSVKEINSAMAQILDSSKIFNIMQGRKLHGDWSWNSVIDESRFFANDKDAEALAQWLQTMLPISASSIPS